MQRYGGCCCCYCRLFRNTFVNHLSTSRVWGSEGQRRTAEAAEKGPARMGAGGGGGVPRVYCGL